ncbi:MAG: nitroreductase [Polaromonas sp.]|uniref:nitroreductase family protein n=1 Tax=Polaromonas sp. TaxID=1869339 RepID=UPI0027336519|nr:nitroreductase [Polaromonas sp.]MDP2819864.1 nitroreductase [Polaromonas sp.]
MGLPVFPAQRTAADAAGSDPATLAAALMQSRQTILPRRLLAPGPDAKQFGMILGAAASAPDHGQLLPWRFVLVPQAGRARLADVFAGALLARDAQASPAEIAQSREKAHRAPLLMLAVVDADRDDAQIDLSERTVSAGCAIQNMLLMATALGFGSALTSGKALKSAGLRALFGLTDSEHALCFVSIGTACSRKPARLRPVPQDFVSSLCSDGNDRSANPSDFFYSL